MITRDDQFKQLAELVLSHDQQISVLGAMLAALIEDALDQERFPGATGLALRSQIEQMSAVSRDAAAAREKARKFLGLPPSSH